MERGEHSVHQRLSGDATVQGEKESVCEPYDGEKRPRTGGAENKKTLSTSGNHRAKAKRTRRNPTADGGRGR